MFMQVVDRVAGELIREIRRESGLRQAELARRAALPRSVVSAYEHGHRQPESTRSLVSPQPLAWSCESARRRARSIRRVRGGFLGRYLTWRRRSSVADAGRLPIPRSIGSRDEPARPATARDP